MYINGHIYRIVCLIEPKIQYVGSTFNELRHRWQVHKTHYKKYLKETYDEIAIYPYFKQYGIENFKIIKIKDYIVYAENKKDHKHLYAYEQLWINKLKCVNKTSAFNPLKYNKRYRAFEYAIYYVKKIANETEEEKKERLRTNRESQSKRQANIRANETEEQKKERLQKQRERNAKKKAEETEEEKKERLEKERKRSAAERAKKKAEETEEEKKERLRKHREYVKKQNADIIANETEEEKKKRLEKQRKYSAEIRANETEEQKKERLRKNRERNAKKKAEETEEEKKERLQKQKEKDAIYRAKKKAEKEAQKNLMANSELKII